MNDPMIDLNVQRELERIQAEEMEAARLEALGAVDLSQVKKQPKVTGPNGEEMTVKEAVALAKEVRRTARRRRAAGRVQHGRQHAIPTKKARFKTRRSR